MVKKLIRNGVKNGSNILFKKQTSIISGAIIIAIMLFASAILGLVKKRLYASIITPGPELDVFFAAFRLPDFIFQLLVGGALNAAFIPIFSEFIGKHDKKASWRFVSGMLNSVLIFFVALGVIFYIFADKLTFLVGVGFSPEENLVLVQLIRVLMLGPILLGISSFVAGTLQSFKRFFLPFLSPVVYNLGAIFGIVFLYPLFGIYGAAWGVVIGAFGHLLIQLPALFYLGYRHALNIDFKNDYYKRIVKLSLPRTFGAGVEQLKSIVLINLASVLPRGSISFFDLGQSITNLPISILGVSIAQASLPEFSSLYARNKIETMRKTFASSFNQILFFVVPISVALIVLKIPVVRILYGTGGFSWADTVLTSWVVAAFAIGITMQAVNALMVRMFYAMQDTKTPVVLSVGSMVVSLVMAFGVIKFFPELGVGALALSVSAGALVESIFLLVFLVRKDVIKVGEFVITPVKIGIASIVTALAIYLPVKFLDEVFLDTTRVVNLLILMWLVLSFGATTYLFTTWLLGVQELSIVLRILLKMKELRENIQNNLKSPQILGTPVVENVNE
ncbi:murein biosynthesis integral membrane protein MurJ [candidate division WWE3 bacterium]|uniref:Probable lipid II flippase MurJ n=1 Tax=candidate division WWE3 bacterium TaxID=2053526 RepID=A0A955RRW0_UNCKA|nr:murein biosynthesis integral membrane protein MurJ [candidate division WWE3 bacterium]